MIRDPWLRALVIVTFAIAAIYLVGMVWGLVQAFADIILLFFLAWLLAFVLEPVVGWLSQRTRMPRLLAIAATYSTVLVCLSLAVLLLVPALTQQVVEMGRNLPVYAERAVVWLTEWQLAANQWLKDHRSPVQFDANALLSADDLSRRLDQLGPTLLGNVVQVATGAASFMVALVLVFILSFYFMVDGARLGTGLIRALPSRARDDARFLVASIHFAFAGFLRGQLIQALVSGIGTGLIMAALGISYALLASVVAGVILLIPFVGPVVAVLVPLLIALFTRPEMALLLIVLLLVLQQVIFNVLAPRIMSTQVGIHPLLVFFAVLAGARVAGIWGAIFGVPVVAVLATMVSFYRATQEERLTLMRDRLAGSRPRHGRAASQEPSPGEPPAPAPAPGTATVPTAHRREAHSS